MKDLQLTDVFSPNADTSLKRLSVYQNGFWSFGAPRFSEQVVRDGIVYRRAMVKFGILSISQTNPANASIFGEPGDYISEGQGGVFQKLTAAEFAAIYPAKLKDTDPAYIKSTALKDPNFLTGVVENYKK